MGCCKCVEHDWEDEPPMEVVFFDKAEEKEYCVFHAPKDEKRKVLGSVVRYTEKEFNDRVFARINDVIKLVKEGKDAKCTLGGTVFPGDIDFYGYGEFNPLPNIDLSQATFWGDVTFFRTTFSGEANFNKAKFNALARFAFSTFKGLADFRNATAKNDGSVHMLEVEAHCLENLTFTRAQLPIFTFQSPRWPQALGLEHFGTGLARSDDPKSYRACEELYRAMKQKAAGEHDQLQVSRWHYREKFMAMKRGGDNRFEALMLRLYYISSGFGEMALQALGVLVALLVLPFVMNSPIGHSLWRFWYWMPGASWLSSFMQSIGDAINASAAIQFIPFTKDIKGDGWQKVGQGLWQGVVILQFTLFALAVRNRFRR